MGWEGKVGLTKQIKGWVLVRAGVKMCARPQPHLINKIRNSVSLIYPPKKKKKGENPFLPIHGCPNILP